MAEIVSDLKTICFALLKTYLQWYNSASLPNEFLICHKVLQISWLLADPS